MTDRADEALLDPDNGALLRDEDGEVRADFVEAVASAVAAGDSARVLALAGDLHEADVGALIEHLEADDRPKLIALMGRDFDFAALTEVDDAVREEILDELPNAAIAEGVKDLDSDDAVYILEDLAEEDQEEVLSRLPAVDRVSIEKSLDYPDGSAGRRMQTEFIAFRRSGASAARSISCATRRTCRTASTISMSWIPRTSSSASCRWTGC